MLRFCFGVIGPAAILTPLLAPVAFASDGDAFSAAPIAGCHRPVAGSVVRPPPDVYSHAGVLNVVLEYVTSLDDANRTLFCFKTQDGLESPTLHVRPGDTLNITLTNRVPPLPGTAPRETLPGASDVCGATTMNSTSTSIHFHGTNTRPVCHADQVIYTLVNSGQTFKYSVTFPRDEPPGLYWYHPHVHGISEAALQGGATGAIVVEGIENFQPAVAKLPERILLLRDQPVVEQQPMAGDEPGYDLSLNYVPISYPDPRPAVIEVRPGQKEFWRVANTAADSIVDLRLNYDNVPQTLEVVALDGVPTGSQDGTRRGSVVNVSHILLPPAGRAEFIITAPPASVRHAALQTLKVDTGPDGDNDTFRTLAVLRDSGAAAGEATAGDPQALATIADPWTVPGPQRYEGIDAAPVVVKRKLYFSEVLSDPKNPASPTNFFITVDGAKPTLFNAANPPAITTTQGSVEEWTIENRSQEVHEFHIHQIHFQLRERDHVPVAAADRQFFDTINVPYWSGKGPYPSVTVAMDFRGKIAGDFVYHCHILGHEDNGMMAIIRVLPRG